jgi:hypothetical protein
MRREEDVSGVNNSGDKGVAMMTTKKRRTAPIKVAATRHEDMPYRQVAWFANRSVRDWDRAFTRSVDVDAIGLPLCQNAPSGPTSVMTTCAAMQCSWAHRTSGAQRPLSGRYTTTAAVAVSVSLPGLPARAC